MLFDQAPELPVATVRRAPGSYTQQLAGALAQWLTARLAWLRPRAVPVTVALLGMFAVLNAVNYLAHPPASAIAASASGPADPSSASFHVKLVLQQ